MLKLITSKEYRELIDKVATIDTTVKEVTVVRINQEVYEALASKLMVLSCPKTELEAAFSLGVQSVLAEIRKGWVVK